MSVAIAGLRFGRAWPGKGGWFVRFPSGWSLTWRGPLGPCLERPTRETPPMLEIRILTPRWLRVVAIAVRDFFRHGWFY